MNYTQAKSVADEIVAKLTPACSRIEIAGSVRREKQEDIHDVEVVAIARKAFPQFGSPITSPLEGLCASYREEGIMTPRLDKMGRPAWGEKFKRAIWNGVAFDLFIVTPETWGVLFLLRTGNADFSRGIVTIRSYGGAMPDSGWHIKDGRLIADGHQLYTPEESDVFRFLDLPFIEPRSRTPETLWAELLGANQ